MRRLSLRWSAALLRGAISLVLISSSASLCAAAGPVAETNVLYASTGSSLDALYRINASTGVATLIGSTTIAGMPGLAVSPTGRLFVTSRSTVTAVPAQLIELDPATGAASVIGSTGVPFLDAIAFDRNGTLWGLGDSGPEKLYQINIATAAATPIGSTGEDLAGMAFDPGDGTLYASAGAGFDKIFTINPSTAVATLLGFTGIGPCQDLAFDVHGILYGVSSPGGGGGPTTLVRINKATGAGTVIGATGAPASLSGMGSQAFLGRAHRDLFYGSTTSNTGGIGSLLTINLYTGDITPIGSTGLVGGSPGLAIDRDGNVFATTRSNGAIADLYRLDAGTGASYRAGSTGQAFVDAIAFDRNNILWAAASDPQQLVRLDPATGAATVVGNVGDVLAGLAFDPSNDQLYGSGAGAVGTHPDGIYTVNTATGQATWIGNTGVSAGATPDIAFTACGHLYGVKGGGSGSSTLIAINKTTGAGSEVGPTGINNFSGLASRAFVHRFESGDFYSFTLDSLGGFEVPNPHLRLLEDNATNLILQNQVAGKAMVRCLTGNTNYASITAFNPNQVTEEFPDCLDVSIFSQPSDVMIWKMPNGDLYKFQVLCFSIVDRGNNVFDVSGAFQADPIESNVLLAVGDPNDLEVLALTASIPNPFIHETRVDYVLPAAGAVRVTVHDVLGRQVAVLVSGHQEPGRHSAVWDGRGAPGNLMRPGVYLVRLEMAGQVRRTKVVKML